LPFFPKDVGPKADGLRCVNIGGRNEKRKEGQKMIKLNINCHCLVVVTMDANGNVTITIGPN
jgi:hypothetical protein